MAFSGSAATIKIPTSKEIEESGEKSEYFAILNSKQPIGYDIPFLLERSGLKLNVIKKQRKAVVGGAKTSKIVEIARIEEFPAVMFIDPMIILMGMLKDMSLAGFSLNSIAKHYKVEEKEEMSYKKLNDIFLGTDGREDMTDAFKYAI